VFRLESDDTRRSPLRLSWVQRTTVKTEHSLSVGICNERLAVSANALSAQHMTTAEDVLRRLHQTAEACGMAHKLACRTDSHKKSMHVVAVNSEKTTFLGRTLSPS